MNSTSCPRCGAAVRVLVIVTDARVIAASLAQLEIRAARAPLLARHALARSRVATTATAAGSTSSPWHQANPAQAMLPH